MFEGFAYGISLANLDAFYTVIPYDAAPDCIIQIQCNALAGTTIETADDCREVSYKRYDT